MDAERERASEKLRLRSGGESLGVETAAWQAALGSAVPDPVVNIRHAPIAGSAEYRTHVAAIPRQVGCHFHAEGDEDYAVVAGKGTLHWGKVSKDGRVAWEQPVEVSEGDSFVIPEGYAHQLRKRGDGDLVIVFGCPDSHLDDDKDRTVLPDAPAARPRAAMKGFTP
jgi:mannose-6-phosphate isomerase-like protein (cupin superfamily)